MGRNAWRNLFADHNFDSGYFNNQLENRSQFLKTIVISLPMIWYLTTMKYINWVEWFAFAGSTSRKPCSEMGRFYRRSITSFTVWGGNENEFVTVSSFEGGDWDTGFCCMHVVGIWSFNFVVPGIYYKQCSILSANFWLILSLIFLAMVNQLRNHCIIQMVEIIVSLFHNLSW